MKKLPAFKSLTRTSLASSEALPYAGVYVIAYLGENYLYWQDRIECGPADRHALP